MFKNPISESAEDRLRDVQIRSDRQSYYPWEVGGRRSGALQIHCQDVEDIPDNVESIR